MLHFVAMLAVDKLDKVIDSHHVVQVIVLGSPFLAGT